jgi:fused-like protein
VGNAAFHDSTLYLPAKCSIQTLVGLLKDGDEKIRSNAAAALGNLARNSEVLDGEFVGTGANYQLVNMVINDKSHSAKRVAIMAIINLLALPESSKILKSLNLPSILSKFTLPNSADLNLAKTAQKALDKL